MKKFMASAAIAALVVGISLGATAPANAAITYPSGGTWDSGANAKEVWSLYHHPSKVHNASTYGHNGLRNSGWHAKGLWAAQYDEVRWFGNKSYYNIK